MPSVSGSVPFSMDSRLAGVVFFLSTLRWLIVMAPRLDHDKVAFQWYHLGPFQSHPWELQVLYCLGFVLLWILTALRVGGYWVLAILKVPLLSQHLPEVLLLNFSEKLWGKHGFTRIVVPCVRRSSAIAIWTCHLAGSSGWSVTISIVAQSPFRWVFDRAALADLPSYRKS